MYEMICDPRQNRLIALLPPAEYELLQPQLELVSMRFGAVICDPGICLQHVYFPLDCVVSLQHVMEDGSSTEVAMAGQEGMVGVSLFMGGETIPSRAIVQTSGQACRLKGSLLKDSFSRAGAMQQLLLRYVQALLLQMAQIAVCNHHHTLEQQICRWVLMSLDRLPSDTLVMTHEFIANLLGVRRDSITAVVDRMQELDLIEHHRSHIRVINRPALEKMSCGCYEVIRKEFARLLPLTVHPENAGLRRRQG